MTFPPNTDEGWLKFFQGIYTWALIVTVVSTILVTRYASRIANSTNLKIAEAKRESALANVRAEELAHENLEIKRKMADRFLTDAERKTIVTALSSYRGHHITVAALNEAEAQDYAASIISALTDAGWSVQNNKIWTYAPTKTPRGLLCKVGPHPDSAVEALKTVFQSIGITLRVEIADAQQNSFIELTVGVKNLD
jgi:hypothetical protein